MSYNSWSTTPRGEPGAARLVLSLTNGILTVDHGEVGGPELLRGPLLPGGWNAIVQAILANAPEASGRMRDFCERPS